MIGIYKITSPSNKINIGQSWNIEQRKNTYSQLGCKGQTKLYNSLKKYGFENHKFEIIHELPQDVTQEVLDQYEIFYINQYKDCGFELMNIREGGSRGKLNEETKQKLSNIKKGKKHSKEHIENIIKSKINSKYKKRIDIGRPRTEETKQKLRKPKPEGFGYIKGKSSHLGLKYKVNHILQYDLEYNFIKEWSSIVEASNILNINKASISGNICNKQRTAGKFIFKYKNNG